MNLVERAKNILISPAKEWEVIKQENLTVPQIYLNYAVILAAIPAIAGFIGYSIFGISAGFINYHVPVGLGILWLVLTYVLSLVGIYIVALSADLLAPSFGATKDMVASTKAIVFAETPVWVAGILYIVPSLGILATLAGIYGLVLLFMGLKTVKEVPKEKMVGYFILVLIISVVVMVLVGTIASAIAFAGLFTSYSF